MLSFGPLFINSDKIPAVSKTDENIKPIGSAFPVNVDGIYGQWVMTENSDPDKRNYIVSNDKLEATGWEARVDIDKGIEELIRAYQIFNKANVKHTNL